MSGPVLVEDVQAVKLKNEFQPLDPSLVTEGTPGSRSKTLSVSRDRLSDVILGMHRGSLQLALYPRRSHLRSLRRGFHHRGRWQRALHGRRRRRFLPGRHVLLVPR